MYTEVKSHPSSNETSVCWVWTTPIQHHPQSRRVWLYAARKTEWGGVWTIWHTAPRLHLNQMAFGRACWMLTRKNRMGWGVTPYNGKSQHLGPQQVRCTIWQTTNSCLVPGGRMHMVASKSNGFWETLINVNTRRVSISMDWVTGKDSKVGLHHCITKINSRGC